MFLGIFSLLFTMFTVCMLLDQSEAMRTNVNAIGRYKKKKSEREGNGEVDDEAAAATAAASDFNEVSDI